MQLLMIHNINSCNISLKSKEKKTYCFDIRVSEKKGIELLKIY